MRRLSGIALAGVVQAGDSRPRTLAEAVAGKWMGMTKVEAGKLMGGRNGAATKKNLERKCELTFDGQMKLRSGSGMGFPLAEGKIGKFDPCPPTPGPWLRYKRHPPL